MSEALWFYYCTAPAFVCSPTPSRPPAFTPTSPCRELSTKLIIIIMFDSNCSQYRQISAVGPHIVLRSLQLLLELTELSYHFTERSKRVISAYSAITNENNVLTTVLRVEITAGLSS